MRIPKHIGIIPDGNRRWALSRQMEKKDGYQYGLEPGMKLLKKSEGIWCGRADLLRVYDR